MNTRRIVFLLIAAALLISPRYGLTQAQASPYPMSMPPADDGDIMSGEVDVVGRWSEGEHESAKAEEYRDLSDGSTGSVRLDHQKTDGRYLHLDAERIGLRDQDTIISAGKWGAGKIEAEYNEIPHNFAYHAVSPYGGVGTENMTLAPGLQQQLQNSTSTTDIANKLTNDVLPGSNEFDIGLMRKRGRITAQVYASDPLSVTAEFKRERREGGRPFAGAFGFGNLQELVLPISWDTTEYQLKTEWTCNPAYLSLQYYASVFENHDPALTWSNPLRYTDSTSPTAYLNPSMLPTGGLANDGPSRGLIALAPDNMYNSITATGVYGQMPWDTSIQGNASLGWMRQNDDFYPYTTNTATVGLHEDGSTFDPTLAGNLPEDSADAAVDTQLYNVVLTSQPLTFMDFKARYRYYEYNNDTDVIDFPGYVRFDAVWEEIPIENEPNSFDQHTAGADVGFDLTHRTKFSLGYEFRDTGRENREVEDMDDNILKAWLDSSYIDWMTLRLAYSHQKRDIGDYNAFQPFPGQVTIPQLPFLRKYDEADRDRDDVSVLATVVPTDDLSVTGSFLYGRDDFDESDFGLLNDRHYAYGLDATYALTDTTNLFGFYNYEEYISEQDDRQWNPGGVGDPFTRDVGIESFSNWSAKSHDKVNTFGGGIQVALAKDFAYFDVSYSYSDARGREDFESPLGTPLNDANPYIPAPFTDVDDVNLQAVNPKLTFKLTKNLSLIVGYLYERFHTNDYNKQVELVPVTAAGAYNGALLMNTLPYQDYEVNLVYSRLNYRF